MRTSQTTIISSCAGRGLCEKAPSRRALVACADLRPRGEYAARYVGRAAGRRGRWGDWRGVAHRGCTEFNFGPVPVRVCTPPRVARRTGRTVALAAVQNCMRSICALSTPNTVDCVYPEPDRQDPGKRYRFPWVVGMRHGVGHGRGTPSRRDIASRYRSLPP